MRATELVAFFMDLIEIPTVETPHEDVSLKDKPRKEQTQYEAVKVELPKNIQKFDKKVKAYTENPYDYNVVALKKHAVRPEKVYILPTQTAEQMILNPTLNSIGKFLGVDTIHDWNKYYDRVYAIVEWAKANTGDDNQKIMRWLGRQARTLPSVGNKTIDNLYIFAKLYLTRK